MTHHGIVVEVAVAAAAAVDVACMGRRKPQDSCTLRRWHTDAGDVGPPAEMAAGCTGLSWGHWDLGPCGPSNRGEPERERAGQRSLVACGQDPFGPSGAELGAWLAVVPEKDG